MPTKTDQDKLFAELTRAWEADDNAGAIETTNAILSNLIETGYPRGTDGVNLRNALCVLVEALHELKG